MSGAGIEDVGFEAFVVGGESGGEGFVRVVECELGLGEVVVGFHVVWGEFDTAEAVVDAGIPALQTEAGHGAVGEEFGVEGVLLDADFPILGLEV